MTDPDVILHDDRAEIVGRLDLTVDRDDDASLSLDPGGESIRVGQHSSDATTAIGTTRVRTAAVRAGEIDLGGGREYENEGRLRVHRGGNQDMEPRPGVDINGGGETNERNWDAEITVYDDGNQSIRIGPDHITMDGGELTGPTRIESTDELQVGAATSEDQSRELTKSEDGSSGSDYEYTAGDVTVKGATGSGGEADTAVSIRGAEPNRNGGSASLFHADGLRTVDVDAGTSRLLLGGHRGDGMTSAFAGESGTVALADSVGNYFTVTAEDGTVSIGLEGDGPLFEIDVANETIRTKYTIEEGVL
mgnify:CR=1 FL=1